MSILTSILRRDRTKAATVEAQAGALNPAGPESLPLIVLLPDASGIASYRYFSFPSAEAAERFVEFDLRGRITHDTVSFWAMPEAAAEGAESVVLIRGANPDSVHAFAFTEMVNAVNFVRHEMGASLTLDRVMIYWAESTRIDIDEDGHARITPSQAPAPQPVATPVVIPVHHERPAVASAVSADVVAATTPREPAPVIDFPSAVKRLRAPAETAKWWTNMIEAMDEVLDAYVAKQVRGRMAWRRLSSEIASAAKAKQRLPLTPVVPEHVPAAPCEEELPSGADTGDDSWFIPRREWGARPDEPFRGFGSPPGRF